MKKVIIASFIMLMCSSVFAQDNVERFAYRAIFELGFNKGINESIDRIEGSYIHAFQVTNNMTVGAGVSLDYDYEFETLAIPIFVDVRSIVLDKRYSPTLGIKIGYSVNDVKGFYMSPSLGYQFGKTHVGIGYTYYYSKVSNLAIASEGISFKIGFKF